MSKKHRHHSMHQHNHKHSRGETSSVLHADSAAFSSTSTDPDLNEELRVALEQADARVTERTDAANREQAVEGEVVSDQPAATGETETDLPGEDEAFDSEVDPAEDELEDEEAETMDTDASYVDVASIFGEGTNVIRVSVQPRILLNVFIGDSSNLPETVDFGDGSEYSVYSPMRSGKSRNAAKGKSLPGLLYEGVTEVAEFVSSLSDPNIIVLGSEDEIATRVSTLMQYVEAQTNKILHHEFPDSQHPVFAVDIPTGEYDAEDQEIYRTIEVPASESFYVSIWPTFTQRDDGLVIFRPTVAINVNMPFMETLSSYIRPVSAIQKMVQRFAKNAELDTDDFRLGFAFSTEDLLDARVLELLQAASYSLENEPSGGDSVGSGNSVVISSSYLSGCHDGSYEDIYEMYPHNVLPAEAVLRVMPKGTDAILLV